jgi:hypothetical protein
MDRIDELLNLADSISMAEDRRQVFVKSLRNAKSLPDLIRPGLLDFIERTLTLQRDLSISR